MDSKEQTENRAAAESVAETPEPAAVQEPAAVAEPVNSKAEAVEQDVPARHQAEAEEHYTDRSSASARGWRNGKNVLIGNFRYKGADYGFTVTVEYSDGRLSNPRYEAHGYGGTSKLSSARLSDDGSTITLEGKASGTSTYIRASYAGGNEFSGSMIRGDHEGSCTMRLQ